MSVAENMCDYIFMIFRGKKVLDGTLAAIQDHYGNDTIRVSADGGALARPPPDVEKVRDLGQVQELRMARGCDPQQVLAHAYGAHARDQLLHHQTVAARHLRAHRRPGSRGGARCMRRILLIAKRDYLATIRTKAFIIGLIVAPVLFGGGFLGIALMNAKPDIEDRHIAVLDRTGKAAALVSRRQRRRTPRSCSTRRPASRSQPRYFFETVAADDHSPERSALSCPTVYATATCSRSSKSAPARCIPVRR